MRGSGGTNFARAGYGVTRTKSRIACFAGPSFHDASGDPADVVCACAGVAGHEADRTGRTARLETKVRRSIPDLPDVMPDLPKRSDTRASTGPRTTSIAPRGNWPATDRTFGYLSRYLPVFLKMTGREKSRPSSAMRGGGGGTGLARSTIASAAWSNASSPEPLLMLAAST